MHGQVLRHGAGGDGVPGVVRRTECSTHCARAQRSSELPAASTVRKACAQLCVWPLHQFPSSSASLPLTCPCPASAAAPQRRRLRAQAGHCAAGVQRGDAGLPGAAAAVRAAVPGPGAGEPALKPLAEGHFQGAGEAWVRVGGWVSACAGGPAAFPARPQGVWSSWAGSGRRRSLVQLRAGRCWTAAPLTAASKRWCGAARHCTVHSNALQRLASPRPPLPHSAGQAGKLRSRLRPGVRKEDPQAAAGHCGAA